MFNQDGSDVVWHIFYGAISIIMWQNCLQNVANILPKLPKKIV